MCSCRSEHGDTQQAVEKDSLGINSAFGCQERPPRWLCALRCAHLGADSSYTAWALLMSSGRRLHALPWLFAPPCLQKIRERWEERDAPAQELRNPYISFSSMFPYHQLCRYVSYPCNLFACQTKPAGLKIPPVASEALLGERSAPGADEQLLDEFSSNPRSTGEEVRLSFAITRFSGSLGCAGVAGRVRGEENLLFPDWKAEKRMGTQRRIKLPKGRLKRESTWWSTPALHSTGLCCLKLKCLPGAAIPVSAPAGIYCRALAWGVQHPECADSEMRSLGKLVTRAPNRRSDKRRAGPCLREMDDFG